MADAGPQSELQQVREANKQLLIELEAERRLRAQSESERAKHQKARDELVRSVLLAEKRAQDAEDEQLRAEQEAATLMQQLRAQQQQQQPGGGGGAAAAQTGGDAAALLAELEGQRRRAAQLEAEAQQLRQRLAEAEQHRAAAAGGQLWHSGSGASLAADEGGSASAGLVQRVVALKAARDKLIAALDTQAAEVERLSAENTALIEAVAELRDVAARWEAQAQLGLAQGERLKDLLEESATWDASPAAAGPAAGSGGEERPAAALAAAGDVGEAAAAGAAAAGDGRGGSEGGQVPQLEALCGRLQRELLLEKARSAQLDLQVRALCMELTKQAQRSGQMQHALVPLLSGVERRLAEVLGIKPNSAAAAGLVES